MLSKSISFKILITSATFALVSRIWLFDFAHKSEFDFLLSMLERISLARFINSSGSPASLATSIPKLLFAEPLEI